MNVSMNKRNILQTLLLLAGLAILIYFIARSGIIENYQILFTVSIPLIIVAFLLSIANIAVKVYRWKYLSRQYGQELTLYEASLVSIPSLFFANITPGKIGDLYKAYFMKQRYGMNVLDGVSMIFYERFFELIILFLVGAAIVFTSFRGITVIVLELALLILVVLFVFYYKADIIVKLLQKVLVRVPIGRSTSDLDLHIRKMPIGQVMIVFFITLFSLVLEFIRLWAVALAFGYLLNPILLSIYMSIAFVAGLVSQIPLGVGVMEGSLNYFIESMGVDPASSIAIVLVDRMLSMYFALVLGFVFSKLSLDALQAASAKKSVSGDDQDE